MAPPGLTEKPTSNGSSERRVVGVILSTTAVILPTLAIYAALGVAPLLVVVALITVVLAWPRCLAPLTRLWPLIALLGALDLWGLLSATWSILPGHSALEALRIIAVTAAGLIVLGAALATTAEERRMIGYGVIAGLCCALLLLAVERFGGTPIMRFWHPLPTQSLFDPALTYYRFDRGVIVVVLTLWAGLFVAVPRWLRICLLIVTAAMTALMISLAALLALAASCVIYGLARLRATAAATLIIAGLIAISAAIPLATPSYQNVAALHAAVPAIKWSGIHRLLIWRFASDRSAERPVLGWGMDASRAIPGGDTDLVTLLPPGNYPAQALALPLHPHNAALQLLLELGLPGLFLGLAAIIWIVIHVTWHAPLAPERRAAALALIASCLTVGLLSFGVWQEWWQSTVWLAAALFVGTAMPVQRTTVVRP